MTLITALPHQVASFDGPALDRLMPMHLRLDAGGVIQSVGPTLLKLLPEGGVLGRPVAEVFAQRRPTVTLRMEDLRAKLGATLHIGLVDDPGLVLRGLAVPTGAEGLLINLSFGIWVNEAVRRHSLTVADFAATDLTVEMLYLVEAKSAVMHELRNLNLRLQGAKVVAEEQALTDTLTGLRNRRALDMRMKDLRQHRQTFGLMHIDLDFFKQVNDTLGHAAGDHVLREVARILTEETRTTDLAARVGGDEFVLVFPGLTDPKRLEHIAARIIERLSDPMPFDDALCTISASIGMTVSISYDHPQSEQMLADADEALYASKRAGRGRAHFYTEPPPLLIFTQN